MFLASRSWHLTSLLLQVAVRFFRCWGSHSTFLLFMLNSLGLGLPPPCVDASGWGSASLALSARAPSLWLVPVPPVAAGRALGPRPRGRALLPRRVGRACLAAPSCRAAGFGVARASFGRASGRASGPRLRGRALEPRLLELGLASPLVALTDGQASAGKPLRSLGRSAAWSRLWPRRLAVCGASRLRRTNLTRRFSGSAVPRHRRQPHALASKLFHLLPADVLRSRRRARGPRTTLNRNYFAFSLGFLLGGWNRGTCRRSGPRPG
jgi:hypothetical protein